MNYELKRQYYNIYRNIHNLQETFEQDPGDLTPEYKQHMHMDIIHMYAAVGERESAITLLNEYLDKWVTPKDLFNSSTSIHVVMMLILMYVSKNSRKEALETLERFETYLKYSSRESDDYEHVVMYVGILRDIISGDDVDNDMLLQKIGKMQHFYDAAKDRLPPDFAICLNECLTACHFKMRNVPAAVEAWKKSYELADKYSSKFRCADLYRKLSEYYENLGMHKEAFENFDIYAELRNEAWISKERAYSEFLISEYGGKIKRESDSIAEWRATLADGSVEVDTLTGLHNRNHLRKIAEKSSPDMVWHAIMFDIDSFKLYMENYGEARSSIVLERTGGLLRKYASDTVWPIRYGLDTFLVLMKDQSLMEARIIADTIVRELKNRKYEHDFSSTDRYVTVSAGIASGSFDGIEALENLCDKAEIALSEAKRCGRSSVFSNGR